MINFARYSFIRERRPVALVPHECDECGMTLRPGRPHCLLIGKTKRGKRFGQIRLCDYCAKEALPTIFQDDLPL